MNKIKAILLGCFAIGCFILAVILPALPFIALALAIIWGVKHL